MYSALLFDILCHSHFTGTLPATTQPTNATELSNTTQPSHSSTSAPTTAQTVKTSKAAAPTTVSSVTSSQPNVTMTIHKFSSTSVTAAPKSEAVVTKTSGFDVGSFIGGIVLTLGILVVLYVGCKTYHSRRGIQYRTIEEHDAII
uniref:Transmembrane protein 123 n=1 Tax=Nothoprocta perdicaria TaxID=30464 RepID=A0A8C6YVS1_NOTPE